MRFFSKSFFALFEVASEATMETFDWECHVFSNFLFPWFVTCAPQLQLCANAGHFMPQRSLHHLNLWRSCSIGVKTQIWGAFVCRHVLSVNTHV